MGLLGSGARGGGVVGEQRGGVGGVGAGGEGVKGGGGWGVGGWAGVVLGGGWGGGGVGGGWVGGGGDGGGSIITHSINQYRPKPTLNPILALNSLTFKLQFPKSLKPPNSLGPKP